MILPFDPSNAEMAASLGVSVDTIERRLKDDPEFVALVAEGRAPGDTRLRIAQQLSAEGWWLNTTTGEKRSSFFPPEKPIDPEVWRFFAPNPISQIWGGKQRLGQSDKSVLETKWGGDPAKIPDGDLRELAAVAFRVLGTRAPDDREEKDEDDDADDESDD